jgi:hypothetical protein
VLFAHLKRILGLERLRLRGPCGVQDEFTLAATAPKTSANWPNSSLLHPPQVKEAARLSTTKRNQNDSSNRRAEIKDFFNGISQQWQTFTVLRYSHAFILQSCRRSGAVYSVPDRCIAALSVSQARFTSPIKNSRITAPIVA